jgi:penicillin-binding protein 2
MPVVLVPDAGFELVAELEERRAVLPGIVIETYPKRRYPFGSITSHVLGYVAQVSADQLAAKNFPGAQLGTVVGKDGLERQYDDRLRGRDGARFIEVDARGRTVREIESPATIEPRLGRTLRTSLDIRLQEFVAQEFPEEYNGAVVAMDPRTGEVLALYSSPTFDPNALVQGMDPAEWLALSRSAQSPLINRAIAGRYPPASPWKLVVAASALRRGLVGLDSHMLIPCRGGLQYGDRYFRCWAVHGDLSLREAIAVSCDVYFYQLGLKITLENMLRDVAAMGLNERSGIDLPGEQRPLFPPSPAYYDRRYGRDGWTNAVTLNLAIGQGENAQTLINVVSIYAMLANTTGTAPAPRLVTGGETQVRSLGLSPADLAGLRDALVQVVRSGTAAHARIDDLQIAGKTGTAQNATGPPHGWFIGFAPADAPTVVVGAVFEFGGNSAAVARFVNRVIARYLLGPDAEVLRPGGLEFEVPADSAPRPIPLLPARLR